MSGILGILNRSGAPVDRDLLEEMTQFMSFRGPDRQDVWLNGAIAFGHTLLRTTHESERERQPCTLDGEVWITADARVDARAELIAKLEAAGRKGVQEANDAELILHAYHVWEEQCPEHLLGDFAFLIWDGRRRVLFGARDQLGVKPFYYAEAGDSLLCGNTLNCIRLHTGVSDELNDLAVADFLLFEWNQDAAATFFAKIRRLPPGHCLVCTKEALRIRRYWTLAIEEVRYRRTQDYVDRFGELFRAAVRDRIRTDKAGVYMSGGLDSTLVAAVGRQAMGAAAGGSGLRAYTIVYESFFVDLEKPYSRLAADFLGMPIEYVVADDYELYDQDRDWLFSRPAPTNGPLAAIDAESYRKLSGYARVALTGLGGDSALCAPHEYIQNYLKFHRLGKLVTGVGLCFRYGRSVPRLGLRTWLKRKLGKRVPADGPIHPVWLHPELDRRYELSRRWARLNPPPGTQERSGVREELLSGLWPCYFETFDPGVTGFPIEQRHPFFDIRVAAFLAGLPALPWCQEKNILRAAGRGILPDSIRLRPKTPLPCSPFREKLRGCGEEWWAKHLDPAPELARYVNLDVLARDKAGADEMERLRLVSLNYWLKLGRVPAKVAETRAR